MTERETRVRAVGALTSIGRWFFALALVGLGAEHFIYREFVVGRAPAWPGVVPGKSLFVYVTGAAVILTGLAIMGRRCGREAALSLGVLVFVWALLRHLPIVVADSVLAGSWTRAGKALTMFGGSVAVAATLPPIPRPTTAWTRFANTTEAFIRLGRFSLASFLIVAGLQHFKFTKLVAALFPAWFPGNTIWWSQLAGALLIAGGIGLLFQRTAAPAGLLSGIMIFSWFWIVHLPRIHASVSDGIALFEALAFSGIALVVAGAGYSTRFQTSSSFESRTFFAPSKIGKLPD